MMTYRPQNLKKKPGAPPIAHAFSSPAECVYENEGYDFSRRQVSNRMYYTTSAPPLNSNIFEAVAACGNPTLQIGFTYYRRPQCL